MSLPSLQILADSGHPLVICARPWAQDLVKQFNPIRFVPITGAFWSDLSALKSTLPKNMRKHALGLVLPDSLSSAALFRFAGIESVGYRDDGRSLLMRWPIAKPPHPVHAVQKWWLLTQQAMLAWDLTSTRSADMSKPAPHVALDIEASDLQGAQTNIAAHNLMAKSFVLLAPTATGLHRGQAKVWPHFAQLAKALKEGGVEVAMCPPPHEREQASQACPDAVLLDPLPLKTFCALTQLAKLVVCNDSGVSHLAAAAGADQLTLFGVTEPANTRPWSDKAVLLGQQGRWPDLPEVLSKTKQMVLRA